MVADSRSFQQSSRSHPGPAIRAVRCLTKSFVRNILRVSTFPSKILPRPRSAPLQWIQRFSFVPKGFNFCILPSAFAFAPLSPLLSRFYLQLLSIQRFCSCLSAKLMIPKDNRGKGIYLVPRVPRKIMVLSHLHSIFYQQLLWIQRFCSCSHANPMIPKDHGERVYPFYEIRSSVLQTAWVQCPIISKRGLSHGLSVLHASVETRGR